MQLRSLFVMLVIVCVLGLFLRELLVGTSAPPAPPGAPRHQAPHQPLAPHHHQRREHQVPSMPPDFVYDPPRTFVAPDVPRQPGDHIADDELDDNRYIAPNSPIPAGHVAPSPAGPRPNKGGGSGGGGSFRGVSGIAGGGPDRASASPSASKAAVRAAASPSPEARTPPPPAPPEMAPANAPNPLKVVWTRVGGENMLHVVSVIQEHRAVPDTMPKKLRTSHTFPELNDPRLRVFQVVMGIHRSLFVEENGTKILESVDIWWHPPQEQHSMRIKPERCIFETPHNHLYRRSFGTRFLDAVARCAFLIDEQQLEKLVRNPAQASFEVYVGRDVARFPLTETLHFPRPLRYIEQRSRPSEGYPTAPWSAIDAANKVVRATGDAAKPRVVALVKRYSWSTDEEMWLLWTLDVVGVDHVVLAVATLEISMNEIRDGIRRHPGLTERVTLIDLGIPNKKKSETYSHLMAGLAYDGFLRWQADFDYAFMVDTDEFIQLFDSTQPRMPRIDVKTFIALNLVSLTKFSQVHFRRPEVRRLSPNRKAEPLLGSFLRELLRADGNTLQTLMNGTNVKDPLGKALFTVTGAIKPYVHFNNDWPSPPHDTQKGFILHIREEQKVRGVPGASKGTLQWFLTQLPLLPRA